MTTRIAHLCLCDETLIKMLKTYCSDRGFKKGRVVEALIHKLVVEDQPTGKDIAAGILKVNAFIAKTITDQCRPPSFPLRAKTKTSKTK